MGSNDQLSLKNNILFLEDVDEMLYHLDRMMMNLKRAGVLNHLETIVVGGMTQMKDNTSGFGFPTDNEFGLEPVEIIRNLATGAGVSVLSGFPAGHQSDNCAFFLGRQAEIETISGKSVLSYL
jgi:muramoyltetrapeptide carboxypeptidase